VLVSFDPSTGDLAEPGGGYTLFDCLARPSGVCRADRGDSAGVRFRRRERKRMGSRSPRAPELVLMDTPAPAPTPEPVSWLAPPSPNPTAGEVHVRWEGPATPEYLEVYDVAGRLVRRLDWFETAPPSTSWDGRDRNGNRVGAGVYRLRATGAGDAPARAVCVLR
jgi:hypothetical protein